MSVPAATEGTDRPVQIGDYAFLSDCHSSALVHRNGSVDWWCVPRFDSPSVFGRLLGPAAGHWSMCPTAPYEQTRHYVDGTLVLRTTFRTADGEVVLTDALAFAPGARGHEIGLRPAHVLMRRIEGRRGEVEMATELAPRMEYSRTTPYLLETEKGITARGGPVELSITGPVALRCAAGSASARFRVRAGETVELQLRYAPAFPSAGTSTAADSGHSIDDTVAGWQSWVALHQGYRGRYAEQVQRSSLVLQGLTFQPSGAVIAAATTSLPETMGGELNFDYRFAWLRDLSLTMRALWIAACPDETHRLFSWIADATGHLGDEQVQIMYGVEGERDLTEHVLPNLPGFRGSAPVRIGNDAWSQQQLDVLGEVLDAAHVMRDRLDELPGPVAELLRTLADRAAAGWQQPDAGMWESRERPRQYTSSKVMCWVALDRAVGLATRLGATDEVERWCLARDEIRAAVLEHAWSRPMGAYAGAFGSDDLDASVLVLPLVGFLPATDDRMRLTIEAIERELGGTGLVRRWPSDASGFLICTYWLAECLALAGEVGRAELWFGRATAYANDLGLLAEEADPDAGELLGNFPQAFSHVGLINAAWRISQAAG